MTYASLAASGDQARSNQSHSGGTQKRSWRSTPVARSTTWMPLYGLAAPYEVTESANHLPFADQSRLSTSPHHLA